MMRKTTAAAALAVLTIFARSFAFAAEPSTLPSTQPSAEVLTLLSKIDDGYSKLQSMQFNGTMKGEFDIAGEKKTEKLDFTSSFRVPNFFKHEAKDDIVLGSTGEKVYAFQPARNTYLSVDAPKEKGAASDWPRVVSEILQQQNPSLLLAITKSPADQYKEMADVMTRSPDITIDGVAYPALQFEVPADHRVITMIIDPKTSLLREVRFDLRKMMESRGAVDVKTAMVTVDYTGENSAAVDENKFAWAPPTGAVPMMANAASADSDDTFAAMALVGKPAPDFTLSGLDDKPVKLSSLKGSVVVLDLWALWCAPCIAALPEVNAFYEEKKDKGLKLFAVNLQDDKDSVKALVDKKKLTLPILLDLSGDVAKAYIADAIPQTVLIGKDGSVKNVFIGSNPEIEAKMKAAVAKEMGQ